VPREVLRAVDESGFTLEALDDGGYLVRGVKPERWVRQTNFDNDEAVGYLADRLARLGVEEALAKAGAEPGSLVRIGTYEFDWEPAVYAGTQFTPGERGLDDLQVEDEGDEALLAFLHLSEKAAAKDFTNYVAVLGDDPPTRDVFKKVLHDETFHMTYTRAQLQRVAPQRAGRRVWVARLRRFWKAYLRLAAALAGLVGGVVLTLQYFLILPVFALAARRAAKAEPPGFSSVAPERNGPLTGQY